MRKLMLLTILAATGLAAVPVRAQHYGGGDIRRDLDQIVQRIHRAEDRDRISKREEDRLLHQARHIERLHHRYRRNGLRGWEVQDLRSRIENLRRNLRFERWEGRGDDRRW